MGRFLALLLLPGLLSGCTIWEYELGTPVTSAALPAADGNTSLRQVLALLGPPHRASAIEGGYVLAWEHWQIREDSLGVSLGVAGADFLSVDWGDTAVSGEFLLLTFNGEHRLVDRAESVFNSDAGGGVALQPFIGLAELTDVDDLVVPMPQHDWGRGWLQRLPEVLNAGSQPDLGQSGIEQRGTPSGIGQRTLEMQ